MSNLAIFDFEENQLFIKFFSEYLFMSVTVEIIKSCYLRLRRKLIYEKFLGVYLFIGHTVYDHTHTYSYKKFGMKCLS